MYFKKITEHLVTFYMIDVSANTYVIFLLEQMHFGIFIVNQPFKQKHIFVTCVTTRINS